MNTPSRSRIFGATLLVSGCCIGAGMLGMPVLSSVAGFQPSMTMFVLCWLFMSLTGLLLLEVTLWFDKDVNIVTMAYHTLGRGGKVAAWALFLFLFYSLMVAYVAAGGELFVQFAKSLFDKEFAPWVGSLTLSILFGIVLYLGTSCVDRFNRFLMLGLVVFYVTLVVMAAPHINIEYLTYKNWSVAALVVPTMIISFGYHNLVPSIANYLDDDMRTIRFVLVIGSAIPLLIYLVWQTIILGLIPVEGVGGFQEALNQGSLATTALRNAVGGTWITRFAELFAFFAIVTSFLGVALSFVDFLGDALHVRKNYGGELFLCLLVLVPPFFLSVWYPNVFFKALNYAGGYGAVLLFGVLPALMLWRGRYVLQKKGERVIGGGKPLLVAVILAAIAIMGAQTWIDCNYSS